MSLPPGPPGPFYLLRYLRDPYGSTLRLFERFGDPLTVRAMGAQLVTTGDPEHIRTLLAADPDSYDAFGVDHLAPAIGAESLMTISGERHRAQRKLLAPPFHGARMRAYGGIIRELTREAIAAWPRGRAFAVQPSTRTLSLRVILRAVLGLRDPDEVARFEHAIVRGIDALKPSLLLIKALQHRYGGLSAWARFLRRRDAMEELVSAELAARRADDAPREDILSMIMTARYDDGSAMSDRQIFETMMTVVVAGHETTAIAIAWALWYLLRDAAVLERLRAELATAGGGDLDAIAKLPYLEAVCHETLRIQPIAGSIARVLRAPMTLAGYELPAGVCVSPSIIALHRRPELYPDPDAFRPERFLARRFGPHEFMPFGGGHRRCLGAAFALYEMKIVLATILTEPSLDLRLASPDRPVGAAPRNTVIGPRRPIELIATAG